MNESVCTEIGGSLGSRPLTLLFSRNTSSPVTPMANRQRKVIAVCVAILRRTLAFSEHYAQARPSELQCKRGVETLAYSEHLSV
jgi:hypothetical protein